MELRSKSALLTNIPHTASGWDCKPEKVFQGRKSRIQRRRSREFASPTFASDFLSEIYRLYREGICCDVILSSGDYETSAHKIVLVASSEYFKSLFTSSDSAKDFIVLPSDISSEALKLVISYMYTGLLCLNPENVLSVFCAASKLQIKAAMFFCHQFYNRNGRNFDSSLPLLEPSLSNHHDQVNDITIKEELVGIDEAEFEGKISSDLLDAHALTRDVIDPVVAAATDEVQAIQVVSRKRRTKAMLQERNDEDIHLRRSTSVKSEVACVPCPEAVKGHGTVEDRRVTAETILPATRSKLKQNSRKRSKEPVVCMSRPKKRRRGPYKNKRTVGGVVKGVKPKKKVASIGQILLGEGTAFRCSICNAGFEKHTGLALHQKFHHEVSVMSVTVKSYLQLLRSVIQQSRKCSLFESQISTLLDESCGQKYECSTCKQKFSLRSEVLSHVMKHHGAVNHWQRGSWLNSMAKQNRFLRPSVYKCRYCKRPFVHRSTMSSHCLVNHKRIKRENCNGDEIPRLKQVRANWLCKESGCNIDCAGLQGLKKHMASKHPDVIYSCPDCRFSCQVERVFQRHRNQRHGKKQMCHLCGKICPKLCQLREHMFICHHIKDPALKLYQCAFDGCTYECSSEIRLADHSRRHNIGKSLKCEECGKAFKHPIGLQKHISTIHRGIRPFICDQCGMGFGFENDLKIHITRHAKIKPYACSHCSFRTCDKSCLQHHLFSCHQIQAGLKEPRLAVQKCDQCNFTTIRKGRFDDHMKKHRNIRDIPCPECGKLFVTKQNLYGHTVAVHRPKSLSCAYCNYTSAILSALKEHVRIMHTHRLEKLYECPVCGFRSATSGNCRKHIQGKHREFGINPRYVGAPRISDLMRAGMQDATANSERENTPNLICKDNGLCVTEK